MSMSLGLPFDCGLPPATLHNIITTTREFLAALEEYRHCADAPARVKLVEDQIQPRAVTLSRALGVIDQGWMKRVKDDVPRDFVRALLAIRDHFGRIMARWGWTEAVRPDDRSLIERFGIDPPAGDNLPTCDEDDLRIIGGALAAIDLPGADLSWLTRPAFSGEPLDLQGLTEAKLAKVALPTEGDTVSVSIGKGTGYEDLAGGEAWPLPRPCERHKEPGMEARFLIRTTAGTYLLMAAPKGQWYADRVPLKSLGPVQFIGFTGSPDADNLFVLSRAPLFHGDINRVSKRDRRFRRVSPREATEILVEAGYGDKLPEDLRRLLDLPVSPSSGYDGHNVRRHHRFDDDAVPPSPNEGPLTLDGPEFGRAYSGEAGETIIYPDLRNARLYRFKNPLRDRNIPTELRTETLSWTEPDAMVFGALVHTDAGQFFLRGSPNDVAGQFSLWDGRPKDDPNEELLCYVEVNLDEAADAFILSGCPDPMPEPIRRRLEERRGKTSGGPSSFGDSETNPATSTAEILSTTESPKSAGQIESVNPTILGNDSVRSNPDREPPSDPQGGEWIPMREAWKLAKSLGVKITEAGFYNALKDAGLIRPIVGPKMGRGKSQVGKQELLKWISDRSRTGQR